MGALLLLVYAVYLSVVLYAILIAVLTALYPDDSLSLTPLNASTTMAVLRSFDSHANAEIKAFLFRRLQRLRTLARSSVLVHLHIPKTGGSALSLALTSNCVCNMTSTAKHSDLCHHCKMVQGSYGSYMYSVSRFNGWRFGVHTPLHALHRLSLREIGSRGLQPIFLIVLREPFERFLSESINWAKDKFFTIDWSAKTHRRFDTSVTRRLDGGSANSTVFQYASLPMHFIIHNRQVKMIGGTFWDFDPTFVSRERIGSVWKPNDSVTSIAQVKHRAKVILLTFSNHILLIHERLKESLCTLEVLYGDLYVFEWNMTVHAHNANGMFLQRKEAYDYSKQKRKYNKYMNTSIYRTWLKKNAADNELYRDALRIFEVQFNATRALLHSYAWSSREMRLYAPHCVESMGNAYGY